MQARPRLENLESRRLLATSVVTSYTLPGAIPVPQGIASVPGGYLWVTAQNANQVDAVNPSTGAVTPFNLPHQNSLPEAITLDAEEMRAAAWFTRADLANRREAGFNLPPRDSIARKLIEDWIAEEH